MKASELVSWLVGADDLVKQILGEASVHRPRRGTRYVASYTDENGRQRWKTTGLADYQAALALAKEWEVQAKAKRAQSGSRRFAQKTAGHLRGSTFGGLSQREVGVLLGVSERTVRQIEKRAIGKLMRHPELRQVWLQYSSGIVEEAFVALTGPEIEALLGLARNQAETQTILKVLTIVSPS